MQNALTLKALSTTLPTAPHINNHTPHVISPYFMTQLPTERVLSIYPTIKGFAYFIAESTEKVIDFGNVSSKEHDVLINKFLHLLDTYYIDRVIFERFDAVSIRKEKAQN